MALGGVGMARLRRTPWLIPVAAALLVAACSGSSGSTTTNSGPSSLPTTSTVPAFTTITIFPTTTTTAAAPEPGSLEANRLLWESQGVERYRMTMEMCAWYCVGPYEVWVDGETVVEIPPKGDDPHLLGLGDVSWLFNVIEGIPPEWLHRVEYDPQWGYPTQISVDDPGSIDEEWGLRVEDFRVTDDPLPEYESPAEVDQEAGLRNQMRDIDAVVEGTVGQRGDFSPPGVHPDGWLVEVDVDTIWYQRPGTPPLSAFMLEVIDPLAWLGLQPHTLQHREGQRLILLLSVSDEVMEVVPAWYASWALQRTDQGLDFLGFYAEQYGFDADLPQVCARGPSTAARSAEKELALLVRWAEEFDRLGPDEPARLALRRACAADDPAGES
jgi:hypothetical protein